MLGSNKYKNHIAMNVGFVKLKTRSLVLAVKCGGDRIRTCGDLRHTSFPTMHLKPLRHPSKYITLQKTVIQILEYHKKKRPPFPEGLRHYTRRESLDCAPVNTISTFTCMTIITRTILFHACVVNHNTVAGLFCFVKGLVSPLKRFSKKILEHEISETPILVVILSSGYSWNESRRTASRMVLATVSAAVTSVFGRRSANSSPPSRATISALRDMSLRSFANSTRTTSPPLCSYVSFTFLK